MTTPSQHTSDSDFDERLQAAIDGDLADVVNTQCVGLGYDWTISQREKEVEGDRDCSGEKCDDVLDDNEAAGEHPPRAPNCIYFIPQLGFKASNGDANYLERMTSLFLKLSRTVVQRKYSIIYAHSQYSLFAQGRVLKRLYRLLPRCYKKNLTRIYVLYPTPKLRACFQLSKLFIEDKVAGKLTFVKSLSHLQRALSPLAVKLPPTAIQLEDSARRPHTLQLMPTLEEVYVDQLSAPPFVARCVNFLRRRGMQREGLFRVPGDQTALSLSARRFRDRECARIVLVEDEEDEDEDPLARSLRGVSEEEEGYGSTGGGDHCAFLIVDDVDEVAQLLKAYLREFSDAVITRGAFDHVVATMREHKNELKKTVPGSDPTAPTSRPSDATEESEIGAVVEELLAGHLPPSHWRTLQYMLTFLADIAAQSPVNKMSPDNISVVFAPTLIRIDMSSPESALEHLPICQKIVRVLLLRRMEQLVADRMSPKIAFSRFE
mmetsp:Transcript_19160/g.32071  ORF Transcript_19160/g.32071 Transcript_19160/m.32071 type:complete len:490 (-) Transcript_19160:1637-3106(-)|eukprot:CAMPEP_0114425440 /NCGR_PEP_ID=MMETSP0103-20121206/7237_1 /TAXON_ID=37642 ORGANISM="Paraphysomonas imperforata, Strain PA2" /NCGR_SAMPLE_ID=MMETSP0103 /ASSEMBLY_ACC=CAM_ASM_000201 /LENGTH=489 /DNA_ID=CAMNT_0001594277 /DNA_START=170 /DNA_END=1639 /DNA_ORIENTATION=+